MVEPMPPIAAESTTSAPMTSHATVGSSSDPAIFNPSVSTPKPPTTTAAPIKAFHQPADGEPWVVYSDGACRGNGRVGAVAGIGVWWAKDDPRNIHERCPGDQTNNRAELIAIIRVLETAPIDGRPLVIKTDSQYSINCLCVWLNGWKEKGWRTSTGKPVLNAALIKYADIMLQERREFARQPVELIKVLGHSGVEGNEGADQLANLGATLPPRPDRDWEDLIRQTQARMAMISPPQLQRSNLQALGPTSSFVHTDPSASAIADAVEPSMKESPCPDDQGWRSFSKKHGHLSRIQRRQQEAPPQLLIYRPRNWSRMRNAGCRTTNSWRRLRDRAYSPGSSAGPRGPLGTGSSTVRVVPVIRD
ncbi:ribonuclease H-like domain-containing protein [Trametes polyzona]|nr:ribonuclease H-like domain-containing protein [Trametes polyzona]